MNVVTNVVIMFEWNERKRQINIEKHGIDFVRAAKIFENPILDRIDDREDYGEERRICIGCWQNEYFVLVYTWREKNRRIISAWKAGKYEKEIYQSYFSG